MKLYSVSEEEGQKKAHHKAHTEMHKHQRKEHIFLKLTKIVCKGIRNFNSIVENTRTEMVVVFS